MSRTAVLLLLLSAINALVLAWWLILYSDGSMSSLAGVRFAAPVVLSVLIPIVSVIGWLSSRRRQVALTRSTRAYVLASIVFLAPSWAFATAMTAVLTWMEEPWPLSMLQGPDTSRAREVFHRNFWRRPSVSQVYARVDRPGTMYIAFSFEDAAIVERIVHRWSLPPVPSSESAQGGLAGPSWSHLQKRSRGFLRCALTIGLATACQRSCGSIAPGVACFPAARLAGRSHGRRPPPITRA